MWPKNKLTEILGIETAIIQAPMASAATPQLAAAVSNSGGLGSLGCAAMSLEELDSNITELKALTEAPFNLNFFCHEHPGDYDPDSEMIELLGETYRRRDLDLPRKQASAAYLPFHEAQLEILLEHRPAVVSFHFGLPQDTFIDRLREIGCRMLCSATTAREAAYLQQKGMDAIIAQGWEAGGHRGSFEVNREDAGVGSLALIPQIVDAVDLPVIGAGGIADGRGIAAAFMLGASAAQIGSAFLSCPEAGISEAHRRALESAKDDDTRLTRAFSGRPCRARNNPYIDSMANRRFRIPDFPMMYHYSRPLMESSAAQGDNDCNFLLYGQAAGLNRAIPASELMQLLVSETDALIN